MRRTARVQEKHGFHLGERIMFTASEDPDNGVKYGQTGTICSLDDDYGGDAVGVEWDIEKNKYHQCSGKCKNHHGWWVPFDQIERINVDIGEIEASDMPITALLT